MSNLPRICWTVSACLAFVEAIWGLQMVVFEGAEFFPAQSYSNLIGWISLALYGTYYRISRRHFDYVDKIQVFLAVIGTVLLAAGATIINVGGPHIPMNIGALIMLVSMGLFAYITLAKPLRLLAV